MHVCTVLFIDNVAYKLFGCTNTDTPTKLTFALHVIVHTAMDTAHSLILFIMQRGPAHLLLMWPAVHDYCLLI